MKAIIAVFAGVIFGGSIIAMSYETLANTPYPYFTNLMVATGASSLVTFILGAIYKSRERDLVWGETSICDRVGPAIILGFISAFIGQYAGTSVARLLPFLINKYPIALAGAMIFTSVVAYFFATHQR